MPLSYYTGSVDSSGNITNLQNNQVTVTPGQFGPGDQICLRCRPKPVERNEHYLVWYEYAKETPAMKKYRVVLTAVLLVLLLGVLALNWLRT